mgnify:CR=1 FL=1
MTRFNVLSAKTKSILSQFIKRYEGLQESLCIKLFTFGLRENGVFLW